MPCHRITAIALTIVCATVARPAGSQTLRDTVRATAPNPVHIHRTVDMPTIELESLAGAADLIVQGRVKSLRTYLSSDEKDVLTDYLVTPTRILSQRTLVTSPVPGPAPAIVLTRWGGAMLLEGVRLTASDPEVPPLEEGPEYVLFLQEDKDRKSTFRDVSVFAGTWRVESGLVQLVGISGIFGKTYDRVRGIPVDRLPAELSVRK
jgi:hypothetical protein